MPSLRQILDANETVLLLDAASTRIQVGWLKRSGEARWHSSMEEAGIGVFEGVEALGVDLATVNAFIFCDGPGSILGIRTVAMALRTWEIFQPRPVFSYFSLALVAEAIQEPDTGVIADARRGLWHCLGLGGALKRLSAPELPAKIAMPDGFRHWSPLPPGVRMVSYDVSELLGQVGDADLFRSVSAPDAFLHEEPSYVTWTPQIHRAPLPS